MAEQAAGRTRHKQENAKLLSIDFQPVGTQVICGRSSTLDHPGNTWCRQLVTAELAKYHEAGLSRKDKTELVTTVVTQICARNRGGIGFVKKDPQSGRWHQLKASQARRKVLDILQEMLSHRPVIEASDTMNMNFLDEYVSRQTASLEVQKKASHRQPTLSHRQPTLVQQATGANAERRTTSLRENVQLLGWPTSPQQASRQLHRDLQQQQQQQQQHQHGRVSALEDLSFQRFLHDFAASFPDGAETTDNPFEPNPLPKRDHN